MLFNAGFNTENTGIKDKSVYRNIPDVIERFTHNGSFDESEFSRFYDQALIRYNNMANDETTNKLIKNYDYDPWDWRRSGEKRNTAAFMQEYKNPMMESSGISSLGIITDGGFSTREIAQTNRVFDVESGK